MHSSLETFDRPLIRYEPKRNKSKLGKIIVKNNEETYFDPDLYSRIKQNHIRNVKALETVV